jgi:hypothetical protein
VRVDVEADRLPRGELAKRMPYAAPEIEYLPVREQRRAQPVRRDVALKGGCPAAFGRAELARR